MSGDQKGKSSAEEKAYIVEGKIDQQWTEEEKRGLKKPQERLSVDGHARQDVITDRRDPYRDTDYKGPERRKSSDRRTDQSDD